MHHGEQTMKKALYVYLLDQNTGETTKLVDYIKDDYVN